MLALGEVIRIQVTRGGELENRSRAPSVAVDEPRPLKILRLEPRSA
jgi:hypothetical protein